MNERMPANLKKAWVDALRSDKYIQGRAALKDRSRYCCLGVLADVANNLGRINIEWAKMHPDDDGPWDTKLIYGEFTGVDLLPTELAEKLGLPSSIQCEGYPEDTQCVLAEMNDNGYSFEQIADYIEENL